MSGPETIGPWRIDARRVAYENPWIRVEHHDVRHPDGSPGVYGVVRFANRAIGVLPIDDEGMTWLVGQHRFPLDRYSWELPEGGGPLAESPEAAARRELEEETGLVAGALFPLVEMDLSNSVTDETAICYLACDLRQGAAAPEPSEVLTVQKVPFAQVLEDVLAGRIRDSLTVVMCLAAQARALRGEFPAAICRRILGVTE